MTPGRRTIASLLGVIAAFLNNAPAVAQSPAASPDVEALRLQVQHLEIENARLRQRVLDLELQLGIRKVDPALGLLIAA